MGRQITRRDFLNGVSVGVGGAVVSATGVSKVFDAETLLAAAALDEIAAQNAPGYYPPAKMGMRGNHDGSFTFAHLMRDGQPWNDLGKAAATGESYDLIVVGGGISGLASAYFYRQRAGKNARILILDNHDDFGGHAKRNEFQAGGRMVLSYGGTQSIESPGKYSDVAKTLIRDIGVRVEKFERAYDRELYSTMGTAAFFDKDTFGEDRLVTGMNTKPWPEFLAQTPLSDDVRRDIARVYTEKKDYLPGMSLDEKIALLTKISYAEYLTKHCKLTPKALPFFQTFPHDLFCIGIEAVPAMECYEGVDDYNSFTYAGFDGLGLPAPAKEEPYIYHFPDGNASIARLVVRSLIPSAMPGSSMEDVVDARAVYSKLDAADSQVRIRLNSTVVHVRNSTEHEVHVAYMRDGKLHTVTGKNCVLACYNGMIPYICPDVPAQQSKALSSLVKMPLVYTHVALRNWEPFAKLNVHHIVAPGSYHTYTALDFPVSLGAYRFPASPKEPAVLFMLRTPCKPGLEQREQNRAGRRELLDTPFATFEKNIRDQLNRMLGAAGFDAGRDIEGITVNRWAHGYAFTPNPLFDPDWKEEEKPWVIGRRRVGRIAIANSDAGASAYTDVAIDQAWRAVGDLHEV
ncbi:MAG TPA: NAD(P)-binding protein [Candidatus Acidoferrum sp.]|jgi:spermidine dehydrogenase|nr:NAD(P)-binding protein [Candidatus Acidoferrum sp.]